MTDRVTFDIDGPIATITNRNPDKHNAFDDEMDARLFEILTELKGRNDIRVVPSMSSPRPGSRRSQRFGRPITQ